MIKELYIDGYLVDIDDNFSIVRQYSSPFFSDVTQLKNNASYSTKIPETQNNSFIMDYLEREDADTTFPYRVHVSNYYEDSFPVFENAEVRVIDAFELQFIWGLNRGKYLPLFEKKLNEIAPNGITIIETDWSVIWSDADMFVIGKKYKYLNYISGERDTEVKLDSTGTMLPLTKAPEPFQSNLKQMTIHPFILFSDILDLITFDVLEQTLTTEIFTLTTIYQTLQNELQFDELVNEHIKAGDLVTELYGVSLPSVEYPDPIYVESIYESSIVFSTDVSEGFSIGQTVKIESTISEFDALKQRLTNKGIILGGNKGSKTITYTKTYSVDTLDEDRRAPLSDFTSSFKVGATDDVFFISEEVLGNEDAGLNITIDLSIDNSGILQIIKYDKETDSWSSIKNFEYEDLGSGIFKFDETYFLDAKKGEFYAFGIFRLFTPATILAGGTIVISQTVNNAMFDMQLFSDIKAGHYNCLMNLPEITAADFINEMLKMTGLFIGHDVNGNMMFLSLDTFKSNLLSGNIYDWSGKVSQKEKSYFQFNSNAQKNWIKFTNSDDRTYTAKDYIPVDDTTLDSEKPLYDISFALAEKAASGVSEFILYKQKVTLTTEGVDEVILFSNEYSEKDSVIVYDDGMVIGDYAGSAYNENVLPNGTNGFVTAYYEVFKDIIYIPRVIDIVVKLDFLETLEIDFEKPVYISDYGKYAVLLDIKIPDDGLCNAKILLINQTL